jgi:predicted acyltransferase
MPQSAPMAKRLSSIDVLRGLDVLLMLFVNQVSELASTPHFLHHEEATVDGMTLTDVALLIYVLQPLMLGASAGSLSLLSRSAALQRSASSFWFTALLSLLFAWGFVRLCGWLRGRGVHMRI